MSITGYLSSTHVLLCKTYKATNQIKWILVEKRDQNKASSLEVVDDGRGEQSVIRFKNGYSFSLDTLKYENGDQRMQQMIQLVPEDIIGAFQFSNLYWELEFKEAILNQDKATISRFKHSFMQRYPLPVELADRLKELENEYVEVSQRYEDVKDEWENIQAEVKDYQESQFNKQYGV